MNHPPAARHINPWHFSPTPCLVPRLLLTPQSSHLSVTSVCPLPSDAAWLSPRSFRITPTIAWFISYTQGTWVMLSPLSILSSPLPFLTYSHFQHCHFFWPCWPCEVEAVLGIETWAESYNVAETNATSQDSCHSLVGGRAVTLFAPDQWSQPFWHQGPVSWKPIFLRMVVGEGRRNGFRMIQVYYIYCALYTHYISSADIKSWSLGTPALECSSSYNCKCSHEKS